LCHWKVFDVHGVEVATFRALWQKLLIIKPFLAENSIKSILKTRWEFFSPPQVGGMGEIPPH
jgi:hypothetical protein